MTKFNELPKLHHVLRLIGADTGARVLLDCVIPEKWLHRALSAEAELNQLNPDGLETLAVGEHSDQEPLKLLCPNADALLADAFDGDLSGAVYAPCTGAADARDVEEEVMVEHTRLSQTDK